MKNKKLLIIIIAAVIIFLATIFYSTLKKQTTPAISTTALLPSDSQLLIQTEVMAPILDDKGENILYFDAFGKGDLAFYRYNLATKKITKISPTMQPLEEIIWSPKKDQTIIKVTYQKYAFEGLKTIFGNPGLEEGKQYTWLYDFRTQKLSLLNKDISTITWLPNGEKIVYQCYNFNEGINDFAIADPDGSNEEKIINIPDQSMIDIAIGALSNSQIYYQPIVSEAGQSNYIFLADLKNKKISKLTANPIAVDAIVSPDYQKIVFEYLNPQTKKYGLAAVWLKENKKMDYKIDIPLNQATFSADSRFLVGVMPGDKEQKLVQLNLESGQLNDLYTKIPKTLEVYNLMLSKDNKILYFTSKDGLYQLTLGK